MSTNNTKEIINRKKYEKLIQDIKSQNLDIQDSKENRKLKLKNIVTIINNFKNRNSLSTKLKKYTLDPIIYYSSYIINELECLIKDTYNSINKIKDPTVKTTITIWPTDEPNSKNNHISGINIKTHSNNYPYSNMDSVEGYIKRIINQIDYIKFNSLPEDEKKKLISEGKEVKLMKPIKKVFTLFNDIHSKNTKGGTNEKNNSINKIKRSTKTKKSNKMKKHNKTKNNKK